MTSTDAPARRPARRRALAGVAVLLATVVAVVTLLLVASTRVDDAAESLARATSGCDTSLDVRRADRYFVFVETRGERGAGDGCELDEPYELDDVPRVRVRVTDAGGREVDLDRVDGDVGYDAGGRRGVAIREVDLDRGTYVIAVGVPEGAAGVTVAVGEDPDAAADGLRAVALLVGIAGALVGGGLLLLAAAASRRPAPAPSAPAADPWSPTRGPAPVAPPLAPPPGGFARPPSTYAPPAGDPSPWAPVRTATSAPRGTALPPPPPPPAPPRPASPPPPPPPPPR